MTSTGTRFERFIRCDLPMWFMSYAFQKKSKKGIETPKSDLDLIKQRLKVAEQDYKSGRK